jgi:SAM-dependent methyltransferase
VFAGQACSICGEEKIRTVPGFPDLARVTSDVKPWPTGGTLGACENCGAVQKAPDARWLTEIAGIYADYDPYHLSNGLEQAVFAHGTGQPSRRSDRLVEGLRQAVPLPAVGRAIDIGCGNGALLAAFARATTGWSLAGHDLNDRNLAALQAIPGFAGLLTEPLDSVTGRFDVVSMIHSLEHFPDPAVALGEARRLLTPDGTLLVQVPDAAANPFDLVVADHRTHFTTATLERLALRCGLSIVALSVGGIVAKELTLVARRGQGNAPFPAPSPVGVPPLVGERWVGEHIAWLNRLVALAEAIPEPRFGVFGTAVGATWLHGQFGERIAFFLDEDPARFGTFCFGRPVLAPADAPTGIPVVMPLAPRIGEEVTRRLAHLPLRFVFPRLEAPS